MINLYSVHHKFKNAGDCSGGDTPLPIPNRVVKPASADGTAPTVGVGE
jgi:hypothetical protein